MGTWTSRVSTAPNVNSLTHHNGDADRVLKDFDTSPPTAAVIGAGIAGVHVAYELAQLGFRVTVFEKRHAVGLGETQFAFPFVGVGMLQPYIHTLRMSWELLRGTLSFTCPNIISAEDSWNSFFSPAIHRWIWARRWSTLSNDQVMQYTNNLSRLSVDTVECLIRKHVSLSPYILSRDVSVGMLSHASSFSNDARAAEAVEIMPTAHPRPLMIDAVGWTRELARICQKQFGVNFVLGEKLSDSTTYLRYNSEMMSSLCFTKEKENNDGNDYVGGKECKRHLFDVVVLTAGTETGPLTWGSSQLPIIGLGGCSVEMSGPLAENLTSSESPTMISLSPSSHLVAYKTLWGTDAEGGSMEKSVILQGLMSFDSTGKTEVSVKGMLQHLEKYLRVKCQINVPLLREYQQQQQEIHNVGNEKRIVAESPHDHHHHNNSNKIRATRYIRAFTPDGVPLITKNGTAFNSFVCSGFGDHAPDMAPGSAKILAKLVEMEAAEMLYQDEEEMKSKDQCIHPVMTKGRFVQLRRDLQMLFNGSCPAAEVAPEEEMKAFKENPFSSGRFGGVVKENIEDVTHLSLLYRLSNIETALMRACEPLGHYVNQQAIKLARKDNMPDLLRTIVYYYFNEEEDDKEMLLARKQYAEGMRRIREEFEGKS